MDQEEKEEAVWSFYNSLLGTVAHRDFSLNLEAFHRPASSLQDLDQAFSKEVWKAIKSLPPSPTSPQAQMGTPATSMKLSGRL